MIIKNFVSKSKVVMTVFLFLTNICHAQDQKTKLKNYSNYSHSIKTTYFRAGNHDPSGQNDYYFTIKIYGVNSETYKIKPQTTDKLETTATINKDEEKVTDKLELLSEEYFQINLKALDFWKDSKKTAKEGSIFKISGDFIREAVSKSMQHFKVNENKIAIFTEITLFEKHKKYFVLNDDTKITQTRFFQIPLKNSTTTELQNINLSLSDSLGTLVKMSVKYKNGQNKKL